MWLIKRNLMDGKILVCLRVEIKFAGLNKKIKLLTTATQVYNSFESRFISYTNNIE